MKLSVIIPVYNNEDFIAKTIESVLKQSFRDFEIILVNDGSSDHSRDIIERFATQDQRIVCINQENQGVSSARNSGLAIAQGEFVHFVDGDDLLPKDSLMHLNQISIVDDCDVISGIYERVDGVTPYTNGMAKHLSKKTAKIDKEDIELLFSWSLCNKWFRKSIIDEYHLRFENYSHFEDAVFLYSYLIHTDKIYSCPHLVYTYRKPLANIGRTTTQEVSQTLLEDSNKAFFRIQEITKSFGETFQSELNRRYISSLIGDYYRRIWSLKSDFQDQVYLLIREYFGIMDKEQQTLVCERFPDLFSDGKLCTVEDMKNHPNVTIILDGISRDFVNDFLLELYDQMMVHFRVEASEEYKDYVDPFFVNRENFYFYPQGSAADIIRKSESRYIAIIDCDVVYDYRALYCMGKQLEKNPEIDSVGLKLFTYNDGSVQFNEIGKLVYEKGLYEFDYAHANKLYRKDIAFKIMSNQQNRYSEENCSILNKPCIIDCRSEEEIIAGAPDAVSAEYRNIKRKRKLRTIKRQLKHKITKADKKKNQESKPKKKKNTSPLQKKRMSAYYNLEIDDNTVLISGLGKIPKGNSLYVLRALSDAKYRRFKVFFIVNDDTIEETEKILEFNHLSHIELVNISSDDYIKRLFSAKYLFNEVDFPNWWIKKPGQIYVNIWHGTPLKKLGKKKEGIIHQDASAARNFTMADFMLFPSEYARIHILTDSDVEPLTRTKGINLGYPRTGILLDDAFAHELRNRLKIGNNEVIVWMPTWNDEMKEEEIERFLWEVDARLSDNQKLFVKLHHKSAGINIGSYENFKHIEAFPDNYDTYEILAITDILITDYSSVFFDYAATGRRIILHCPDIDSYMKQRGLYLDITEFPFPVTHNTDELIDVINTQGHIEYKEFQDTYNPYDSIDNAKRLCEVVLDGKEDSEEVESINDGIKETTFVVSDGFGDAESTKQLFDFYDSGQWTDDVYLSFYEKDTDATIDQVETLLRKVPIYALKGKPLDERSERKRLYNDILIKKVLLIDPSNPKRIRAFSRFHEPVYLFITDRLFDMISSGNEEIIKAVKFFSNHGEGMYTYSEEISKGMKESFGLDVSCVSTLQSVI